jgi:hypothetical protein
MGISTLKDRCTMMAAVLVLGPIFEDVEAEDATSLHDVLPWAVIAGCRIAAAIVGVQGVAAINILGRGLKMLKGQDTADASARCESTARIACEVNGEVKQQQEPTEMAA